MSVLQGSFKIYGHSFGEYTFSYNLPQGWSAAQRHYISEKEFFIPSYDGDGRLSNSLFLYRYNAATGTSYFNEEGAQWLDSNIPLWQQATIFYFNYDNYSSNIPKTQALKLFPNRYKFENFGYDALYITRDDMTTVFAIQLINSGQVTSFYAFNKNTLQAEGTFPFSAVIFTNNNGIINNYLCFYAGENSLSYFNTTWSAVENYAWQVGQEYEPSGGVISNETLEEMEEINFPSVDPYKEGGESETGGGNGDFERTGGSVPIPDLPTLSAADTGFITLFNPTTAQLKNLAEYMWSGGFDVDTFKKIVADPMECILGLSIVPVNIPSGGSAEVKIGNIGTGVSMTKASSQYVVKDCGSLNLKEYWGSYLDYSPYTKVTSLYLPYVGVVSVDSDIIMNKTLGVKYHIDVLSGQCIAYITVNGNVNFQYQGACSVSIPVTSVDYSSMISAGMNIVSSIAGIGAAGAAGGMMMGGPAGAAIGAATAAISAIPSVANNVMQSKPDIKSGGSVGGMGGMMGVQYPFLIIEWPRQSVPAKQNSFTGYPSNIRARLGSLSGYTECDMVIMDKVSATDAERAEIENLLKGGVYL